MQSDECKVQNCKMEVKVEVAWATRCFGLILGAFDADGSVVLIAPDNEVPVGQRMC